MILTTEELNTIVQAVIAELEKSGVDFDYKAEQAKDDDLVFVIRGTAPNYQGVTVTWKGLLDIITAQATQAKNDAETAKNAANTILEQVQSKGTEITNFVATSKAELETQKNESVNAVKSVYQTDLNELKGDLKSIYNDIEVEGFTKSFITKDCVSTAEKTSGAFCYNAYVEDVVMIVNQPHPDFNWYQLTVKEGEIYHIKTETIGTPRAYYFAKSDGTYISRVPNEQATTETVIDNVITIPSGVELLCVNERTSYSDDFVFESITESFKFSYGKDFIELFENVSKSKEDISNLKQNVFEGYTKGNTFVDCMSTAEKTSGKYCYNGYVDSVEKILEIDIASYNYYKLDVSEGETYHIRTTTQNTPRAYYFAKSDGTYISRYPNQLSETLLEVDELVTIPLGVEALYINQYLNTSIPFVIEKKVGYSTYKRNSEWYSFDSLYGKKMACVGDSITEATNPNGGYFKNYAQIVAERHNMNVYKDGVGGSTMANVSGHNAFSEARYLNVPSDYDILTIWFGWNDATYAQVGTIDDTTDTTFYGAYNKVLEYFITTYPTKKIGLIVPYGNSSVEPFRVAVRNLSEKFGVPCLDLTNYNQCSCIWGTANESQEARRSALTYDGTHPNQDGHIYLSTMYEEFIKRL